MLSSSSPGQGLPSPCQIPVQGHYASHGSSESTPPPGSSFPTPATRVEESGTASRSSPGTGSQTRHGPASPKTPSPLRCPVVPGSHEEKPSPTPVTSPFLDHLPEQQVGMSLTGDKKRGEVWGGSQQSQPGAWYMRRNNRAVKKDCSTETQATSQESAPTRTPSSPTTAAASTPAANTARSTVISPASTSRFAFFNMASTLKGLTSTTVSVPKDDELINLDIEAALFPGGSPCDAAETFSPAAFKNLHMNAAGLLRKFQAAYQDKAITCQELRAERDAQEDEKFEVQTRTAHLKMQLEGMAQKAADMEAMMQALIEELGREKRLRAEETSVRETGTMSSGMSTISEDLGAEDDQKMKYRRRSDGTTKSDEGSFETDDESIDEASVFSRSRSPTLPTNTSEASQNENQNQGSIPPPQPAKPIMLEQHRSTRQSQPQISAIQKLFKGIAGDPTRGSGRPVVQACQNCQGQDASVAWDTASLLRDENKGLKQRVGELESAVEEALDAVMGVRL